MYHFLSRSGNIPNPNVTTQQNDKYDASLVRPNDSEIDAWITTTLEYDIKDEYCKSVQNEIHICL